MAKLIHQFFVQSWHDILDQIEELVPGWIVTTYTSERHYDSVARGLTIRD